MPGPANGDRRFDPLRLDVLSQNLQRAVDDQERVSFPPPERFAGAGLYALYYTGDLPLYKPLHSPEMLRSHEIPIYVGKAEAGNSSYGDPSDDTAPKLYDRIAKHAVSIQEVADNDGNLGLHDFEVRYLILDDVWIVLGERALLRAYAPVLWNTLMPGFGANPPGGARQNARSIWDTVHPGRPRAGDICNRRFTRSEMEDRLRLGLTISGMDDGPDRDAALKNLRARRANQIWTPARTGSRDRRLRVFRVDEFLRENAAINASIDPGGWVQATDQARDAEPDPEEVMEQNALAAERPDDGDM